MNRAQATRTASDALRARFEGRAGQWDRRASSGGKAETVYEFDGFRLDPRRRRLSRMSDGQALPVTQRVFDTLLCLVEHAGETLAKDRLTAAVWPGHIVEDNNLAQNISALRRGLGENRFVAPVRRRQSWVRVPPARTARMGWKQLS